MTSASRRTTTIRLAASAAVLAFAGGMLGISASSAGAITTTSPGGSAPAHGTTAATATHRTPVSWAATVTGRKVMLAKPVFAPTPVRPFKLTHPAADFMGAVNRDHAPWGHSVIRPAKSVPQLPGIDISAYQGNINWGAVAPYIDFSYTKATEGRYYTNPYFYNQYVGPYDYGVIRGSYHFGIPPNSSGQSQANYFISHGGGWSADGRTLPGALDIEYNPYPAYGNECYNFTASQMVSWIHNFITEYAFREHAYPVIYSTTNWWATCTGNYGGFASLDPLWIANYSASGGGPLPNRWGWYTFWQYADAGSLPGDQDVFNGAYSQLQTLAKKG
ncbi:MAG TPA: GH25 family lysozyme [Streptosporangiaceae bacterium]|nr:GH25 family lysozyme [Streptosporangiaceae bacterium]